MQPNAEMSSGQATFNLKAAREACTKLYLPWTYFEPDDQIHSQLVETEYGEYGSVICRYQEEICQFLRETRSREIIAGVNKLPAALDAGLEIAGYMNQASFLLSAGLPILLEQRRPENPSDWLPMANAVQKLTSPAEMGELFKVLLLASRAEMPQAVAARDQSYRL